MLYRLFFRLVLVRIDPERAHRIAFRVLRVVYWIGPLRWLLRRWCAPSERLATGAFAAPVPSPLGVAAGVDKDAGYIRELTMLGFGFAEIGTVTPKGQSGNPFPRVFRLTNQRALINRMGFPNKGAEYVDASIGRFRGAAILGINIGKNKDTSPKDAAADYASAARSLGESSDFVVVNVSSPNTPGLRDLQAIRPLRRILVSVKGVTDKPVLLKISPDLADADVDEIVDLALELGLAGIVCTNTTISREGLPPGDYESGGLSGDPLKGRSVEVLRRVRARAGDDLTLISVGGISTADDVWERLAAGATLVQAYTAFVYGGPLWARRINRDLAKLLADSEFDSIAGVVGSGTTS